MKNVIFDSPAYDIELTESMDFKGAAVYVLRYGLEVAQYDCLQDAVTSFKSAVDHAVECDGVVI